MTDFSDIQKAYERIRPFVRRTPMMAATSMKSPIETAGQLYLKLESQQVTSTFKARGAISKMTSLSAEELKNGLFASSGGNHGVAVAYAGTVAGVPAHIFVPQPTPNEKRVKIEEWHGHVIEAGATLDKAHPVARAAAQKSDGVYIHPFDDPQVMAGQGTLGIEMIEDLPDMDAVVIAIGGGGLIAGVATAIKHIHPKIKIYGVEPEGAATLHTALQEGQVVTLPKLTTQAGPLALQTSTDKIFDIVKNHVEEVVLVSDQEMLSAACWLWDEFRIAAEMSGAASLAALLTGKLKFSADQKVCALICGAGTAGVS